MDDLNPAPVPPAAARDAQPAAPVSQASESLADPGSPTSHSNPTLLGEPIPRRGAARRDWIVIAACVVILMTMGIWLFRSGPQNQDVARPGPKRVTRDQFVEVGGVRRPATDVRGKSSLIPDKLKSEEPFYGTYPKIPKDANPAVTAVMSAIKTGENPERLSSLIAPKPFDSDSFAKNPKAYLDVVEPGRVWQPAQPGPGVRRISALSELAFDAVQGEPTVMKVKVTPHAPVTFTAFDGGAFENHLNSITVQADGDGLAKATFVATTGVINDVNLVAASPVTSGQLKYVASISLPRKTPLASVNRR